LSSYREFKALCASEVLDMTKNRELQASSTAWMQRANAFNYSYHFEWLGRPIIQYPQDIVALQEIIWNVKPDLIIETGIAHGGSLILNSSILALLDLFDIESGIVRDRSRRVVGVDIDIREHNKIAILEHPLSSRIELLEGSSTSVEIISKLRNLVKDYEKVMVILDSNHTYDHVKDELEAYSSFVTPGQFLVVFDTVIEKFEEGTFPNRNWGKGNNPMIAVNEFLEQKKEFTVMTEIENKLLITVAPNGYLRKKE
jgi:cephalosporin hydroxylase